jgi:hypothetical protein
MKKQLTLGLLLAIASTNAIAQAGVGSSSTPKGSSEISEALRALLVADLRSTHNQPEWFLPLSTSVAGLTPEQAKWIPTNSAGKVNPNANHSVGMIANHILFWDRNALAQLKGEPITSPNTNDETFNNFNPANWKKLYAIWIR